MKRFAICLSLLLLAAITQGQAQYSNSNLSGTYAFQLSQAQTDTWSKTFNCWTGATYTATNSMVTTTGVYGTVTFDGAGNFTYSLTQFGAINQSASGNTMRVLWNSVCGITSVDLGQIVYLAPKPQTGKGTYAVNQDGTGSMTEVDANESQNFVLASTSNGVSAGMLVSTAPVKGQPMGAGSAAHQ